MSLCNCGEPPWTGHLLWCESLRGRPEFRPDTSPWRKLDPEADLDGIPQTEPTPPGEIVIDHDSEPTIPGVIHHRKDDGNG